MSPQRSRKSALGSFQTAAASLIVIVLEIFVTFGMACSPAGAMFGSAAHGISALFCYRQAGGRPIQSVKVHLTQIKYCSPGNGSGLDEVKRPVGGQSRAGITIENTVPLCPGWLQLRT